MTLDDARPSSSKVCSKDLLHLTSMATDGPMASSCLDTGYVVMVVNITQRERERENCFKEFKEFSFCAVNAS